MNFKPQNRCCSRHATKICQVIKITRNIVTECNPGGNSEKTDKRNHDDRVYSPFLFHNGLESYINISTSKLRITKIEYEIIAMVIRDH
ncbi:unnamed protein product [Rhizophagus irregularis]|uniref:Uncharacterized protein n=1 Tax=Rhizophagus irregularis TaxID=588596 RepID=A0A915Z6R6_9GLOM|nr:unnamed protein product [Rhizophagus irregularis]CAB5364872.1 unnamed protein product [Rhizophagus irregularis]